MTPPLLMLVIAAILCNVGASALLKQASSQSNGLASYFSHNGFMLGGGAVLLYFVAFVLYALVLRDLPVSKAYTMITFGAQAGLILVGYIFFGERFGALAWLGVLLILLGLILIGRSTSC